MPASLLINPDISTPAGTTTPFLAIFVQLPKSSLLKHDTTYILGIDPGTLVMGYGLISITGNQIALVEMGVLQLSKYKNHAERLRLIFQKMESLIRIHQPSAVAIEAPFFGKNVQSMLKLGRAQGVAIAAAMMSGLQATEYAPRKVKQAVTGRGNASKEQVWEILKHTLNLREEDFRFFDATDAVAVAICHFHQNRLPVIAANISQPEIKKPKSGKKNDWAGFIAQNPERIKLK